MLLFDDTENAIPNPTLEPASSEYESAKLCIELYHLHYKLIVGKREAIWKQVERLNNEIQNLLDPNKQNPLIKEQIESKMRELRKLKSPKSELSATAKASLLSSEYVWARELAAA